MADLLSWLGNEAGGAWNGLTGGGQPQPKPQPQPRPQPQALLPWHAPLAAPKAAPQALQPTPRPVPNAPTISTPVTPATTPGDVLGFLGNLAKSVVTYPLAAAKSVTVDPAVEALVNIADKGKPYAAQARQIAANQTMADNPFAPVVQAGNQLSSALVASPFTGNIVQRAADQAKQNTTDTLMRVYGGTPQGRAYAQAKGSAAKAEILNRFLQDQGLTSNTPAWQVAGNAVMTQAGAAAPLSLAGIPDSFAKFGSTIDRVKAAGRPATAPVPTTVPTQVEKIAAATPVARSAGASDAQIKQIMEQGVGSNRAPALRVLEQNQAKLSEADRLALTGGERSQAGLPQTPEEHAAFLARMQKVREQAAAGTIKDPSTALPPTAPPVAATPPPTAVRGLTSGIKGSPEFSPQLRKAVASGYDPFTNKAATMATNQFMQQPLEQAKAQVMQTLAEGHGTHLPGASGNFRVQFGKQEVANAGAVMKALDASGDLAGAQAVHDLLAAKLTNAGQTSQAAALIYNRTPEGLQNMAYRDLTKAGVTITPELKARLDTAKAAVRAAPDGTRASNLARAKYMQLVGKQIPTSAGTKALSLYKTGILSSPKTAVKVAAVQLPTNLLEQGADTVGAGFDRAISLFNGKRSFVAPNPRNVGYGLKTAMTTGLKDAGVRFKDNIALPGSTGLGTQELSTGFRAEGANFGVAKGGGRTALDRLTHGVSSKVLNGYTSSIGRVHGAIQTPFYEGRAAQSLMQTAQAEALNRGLSGPAADQFINDFVAHPPKAAQDVAQESAQYATSQQKTALGRAASGLQHTLPGGQIIAPITRIPGAVATQVINYSPLGYAKTVGQALVDKSRGEPFNQQALSRGLGRATVGSGLMAGGVALAARGRVSGAYPKDKATQQLWQSANIPANSVYVGGTAYPGEPWRNRGGTWQQVGSPGGAGAQAALTGGAILDGYKQGGLPGAALQGAQGAAQIITNQPYLTGIAGAMGAINTPAQAQSFFDQTAGSIVPNAVRDIASATDPLQRQTAVQSPVQSVANAVTNGIPGLREQNQPQLDVFGNSLPRNNGPLTAALDPLNPQQSTPSALTDAMGAVHNAQDINGKPLPIPTQIDKKYAVTMQDGTKQALTDQQRTAFIQQSGQAAQAQLNQLIQTPQFQQATPAQQSKFLSDIVSGQRDLAKSQLAGAKPGLTTAGQAAAAGRTPIIVNGKVTDSSVATPQIKYQTDLAKYQQQKAAGTLTPVQDYKLQNTLAKEAVTSAFPSDVTSLYGLGKSQVASYLKANPQTANQTYAQLQQLDQQLYQAGISGSLKFANGLSSAASGTRRTTARVAGRATKKLSLPRVAGAKLKTYRAPKISVARAAKVPKFRARQPKFPSLALKTPKVTRKLA